MNNRKIKIAVLITTILVLMLGVIAFVPFDQVSFLQQGDETEPQPEDHLQALADALEIPVEDLQAAYEAASRQALETFVNNALESGKITQERADELLSGEADMGPRGHLERGFGGENFDELVAAELDIPLDVFQAAQAEVQASRIEQAIADGKLTQEEADLMQARKAAQGYFENAWTEAYQNAVQQALDDNAITQDQADLLLENMENGGKPGGFGGMMFGGRGGHHRPSFESGE